MALFAVLAKAVVVAGLILAAGAAVLVFLCIMIGGLTDPKGRW